ncbi:MAG TPA: PRC-barrel domain-containing protein [Thermohalobaculum sp.]|nr:PRC-barrel domain-containing protein [Thermohalobaculum sp.]
MRLFTTTTALAAVLALPGAAMAQTDSETGTATGAIDAGQIVTLNEWRYDDLYAQGWSAENFIDEMKVYDENGEEIGDVEDLIVDPQGKLLAVIAEVGGLWDIGDTHVSVPWDRVTVNEARDGVVVPLTEENVGEYDAFAYSGLEGSQLGEQVAMGADDAEFGARAFRISELIGDYARLTGEQAQQVEPGVEEEGVVAEEARPMGTMRNYGYVSDVIISDGEIAATVVEAASGFGGGSYAYPYYGYDAGFGWEPGNEYYDMPYAEEDIGELEEFQYEELDIVGVETETETGAQ